MAATTDRPSTVRFLLLLARDTALFLNGYTIGVIGGVITLTTREYHGNDFGMPYYSELLASAVLAGTVCGMLLCGWTLNGIQSGMILSPFPIILICSVYSIWASDKSPSLNGGELVRILCFIRFILGICVGAGHSSGSAFPFERWVKQDGIFGSTQHWWFVLGTKTMIDTGFVVATSVPLVLHWIYGEWHHLTICNVSLGLGAVPAFVLLWELVVLLWAFEDQSVPESKPLSSFYIPYWFTLRQYWKSVLGLSLAWFIYDFIMYPVRQPSYVNVSLTGNSLAYTPP